MKIICDTKYRPDYHGDGDDDDEGQFTNIIVLCNTKYLIALIINIIESLSLSLS